MKYLAVFVSALFTLSCYSQDKTKENSSKDFRKVQIGINISPDLCLGPLRPKAGYTTGLNVCYNFKEFVGLEAGLQYSNKGYQTEKKRVWGHFGPGYNRFIYNFHYIDLPVKVNFAVGNGKRARFFGSVGVTTNILFKATEVIVYPESSVGSRTNSIQEHKTINISPTISMGFDYRINDRMNLRVEPTFRYGVLFVTDVPHTTYLSNLGINISYYFGL